MDLRTIQFALKLAFLIFLIDSTNARKLDLARNEQIKEDTTTTTTVSETTTMGSTTTSSETVSTSTTTQMSTTTTTTELVDEDFGNENNFGNREVVLLIVCIVTGAFIALGSYLLWKNLKKSKKNKAAKQAAKDFAKKQQENTKYNRQLTIDNQNNDNTSNNSNNNTETFNQYTNSSNPSNSNTGNKQTLFIKNNSSSRNLNSGHVGFIERSVDELPPPRRGSHYPRNQTFVDENDDDDSIRSDRDNQLTNNIPVHNEHRRSGKESKGDYVKEDASKNFTNLHNGDLDNDSVEETRL